MIQGQAVTADYYVLPVAACQVVLGVQWLATLGPIETDYTRLTMSFKKGGVPYKIQGLKNMGIEILSEKEINSLYDSGTCFAILQSDTQTP